MDGTAFPALVFDTWQPLPQVPGTQCFLLSPAAEPFAVTTLLLRTSAGIVCIDPGSSANTGRVRAPLDAPDCAALPRLFLLTHCHCDHSAALDRETGLVRPQDTVAAHQAAVVPLRDGDAALTQAALFDRPAPRVDVALPLFAGAAPHVDWQVSPVADAPCGLPRHELRGHGLALTLHAAPGHSPDSVLITCGPLCLTGDLTYAANPVIAGIVGWDRAAYLQTAAAAMLLLETQPSPYVLAAHAAVMPGDKVRQLLRRARAQVERQPDPQRFDTAQLEVTVAATVRCAGQLQRTVTAVAARLQFAQGLLAELGEAEAAAALDTAVDYALLDSILDELAAALDTFARGETLRVACVVTILNALRRLAALLARDELRPFLDVRLLRRLQLRLDDCFADVRGLPRTVTRAPADAAALVRDTAAAHAYRQQGADLLAVADDAAAFSAVLAQRLAATDPLQRLRFTVDVPPALPALLDAERFAHAFDELCLAYAAQQAQAITVHPAAAGFTVAAGVALPPARLAEIADDFAVAGATAAAATDGHSMTVTVPAQGTETA